MSKVILVASGSRFEINVKCLEDYPLQRLPMMVKEAQKNERPLEFYIDRPAERFAAIVAFYQTGELHIPAGLCPGAFQKEILYWDIDSDKLSECCAIRYISFLDEQETARRFRHEAFGQQPDILAGNLYIPVKSGRRFNNCRNRLWNIVDNNEISVFAKAYFLYVFLLIMTSIFSLALSTEKMFMRKLTKCEMLEYLEYTKNEDLHIIEDLLGNPSCDMMAEFDGDFDWNEWMKYLENHYDDGLTTNSSTTMDATATANLDYTPNARTEMATHSSITVDASTTMDATATANLDYTPNARTEMATHSSITVDASTTMDATATANLDDTPNARTEMATHSSITVDASTTMDATATANLDDTPNARTEMATHSSITVDASTTMDATATANLDDTPNARTEMATHSSITVDASTTVNLAAKTSHLRKPMTTSGPGWPDLPHPPPPEPHKRIEIPDIRTTSQVFDVIDLVLMICFSLDLLLRLFSCPSIPRYFLSVINVLDMVALIGTYIYVLTTTIRKDQKYVDNWLDMIEYLQILRTLRLFRIVKNVRATKVLMYALKMSFKDLGILLMFLFIAVCTFASIIYFTEDRDTFTSIPTGWWWAIVTLTTVGYGDLYPATPVGRIVGSACALAGIALIALTLPIFVNNFLLLYQYALVVEVQKAKLRKTTPAGPEKLANGENTGKSDDIIKQTDGNKLTLVSM